MGSTLPGPGYGGDSANAIAVDESGNVYVTGDTYTSGISSSTVKYNSNGQQQWVTRYEQAYYEAHALTIDSASNVYVTGEIRGDPKSYPDYGTIKSFGRSTAMAGTLQPAVRKFI